MFSGIEEDVTVELENSMCGVFIDRFGKDISFQPIDNNHSKVRLKVDVSEHFISWIYALGDKVKIVGNDKVLEQVRSMTKRIYEQYM